MCAMALLWRLVYSLWESSSPSCHVEPENQSQVTRQMEQQEHVPAEPSCWPWSGIFLNIF